VSENPNSHHVAVEDMESMMLIEVRTEDDIQGGEPLSDRVKAVVHDALRLDRAVIGRRRRCVLSAAI